MPSPGQPRKARGTAAFAHAAAQLPAEYGEEVASLLQRLRSKLMGFAAEGGSWGRKTPQGQLVGQTF